jgi:tripartite-type tricarboxylate transporter receptor subunit TctC
MTAALTHETDFLKNRGMTMTKLRMDAVLLGTAMLSMLFVHAAPAAAASSPRPQDAAGYPSKPIRFVIPFPPGSFSDVVGRIVGHKLSESTGQSVVADTRAGASGNIGAEIVANATPDGYTLLINSFNFVANPSVMPLSFDPIKDFAAVSLIADGIPLVIAVNPAAPYKTVQDLINAARTRPGQLNFATAGTGTSSHLAIEMLRSLTGLDVNQVPYKGTSQSLNALIAGEITCSMPYLSVALPLIKAGRLRGLAVTGTQRSAALRELPTMVESGYPGFVITGFLGLLAPAKTPKPVIAKLHREIVQMTRQQDFIDRIAVYDLQPVGSTPEAFAKYTEAEIGKWTRVLNSVGYKRKP